MASRLAKHGGCVGVGARASLPSVVMRKSRFLEHACALRVWLTPWLAIRGLGGDVETRKRPLPSMPTVGVSNR
jgi:hypothetical protein